MDLPKGTESSLVTKMEEAISSLDIGEDKEAVNKLNAFINQVIAQKGKKLTDEEAEELISEAQRIMDNI